MFNYTICFLKQNNHILLLNREKPSWMGRWNGVGGKIENGETPRESVLREVQEETGIHLDHIEFKGLVTWFADGKCGGGMYTYFAELPADFTYETPIKTPEGILDWKAVEWILHPKNVGVADIIPRSLKRLMEDTGCYEHRCYYEQEVRIRDELHEMDKRMEHEADKEVVRDWFLREQWREVRSLKTI